MSNLPASEWAWPKRGRRSQCGLTLVEVVVALAVFAFSLAMLMPNVTSWMRGLGVRSTAESMRAGLELARMEALRRNTSMGFWLVSSGTDAALTNDCEVTSSGTSWVVSGASPADSCMADPSTTVAPRLVDRWSGVGKGVVVAGVAGDGAATSQVVFNSLGQLAAGGLRSIDVTHTDSDTRALRIQIEAGGSVRLCDPAVSGSDPRRCL